MTEAEENDLRALGDELAAALQSPWEPRCICAAFGTDGPASMGFTMQQWIDLERARSPLLHREPFVDFEQLEATARIFGMSVTDLSPEDAVHVTESMQGAVDAGFALALAMRHPQSEGDAPADDFGTWLPLYAALVAQCGLDPDAALRLRVDRAFALLAGVRRNEGWQTAGTPYQLRDAKEGA